MARRGVSGLILPSIGDALFMSILAKTLFLGRDLLNDGDTGWHIAAGMHIMETMSVPSTDIFSFTAFGEPWTAHEWLSEVVFALVHTAAGLNGVVTLTAVVIALTFFYLYRHMLNTGVTPLLSAALTIIAVLASSSHWLARPHIFSMFLTLYFYTVLDDYQNGRSSRLIHLPFLMLMWVNLHAGFFLGILLVLIYLFSNLLSRHDGGPVAAGTRTRALGYTAAASALATLVNPSGPSILSFPFHLTGRDYVMDNVQEWASTNFHAEKGFELALLLVLAAVVISVKRLRVHELVMILLMTHMALVSARFIELFSVTLVPLSAGRIEEALSRISGMVRSRGLKETVLGRFSRISASTAAIEGAQKLHPWVYASVAACAIVCLNGGTAFGAKLMDYRHDPGRFPVNALEFAMGEGVSGNMFNVDSWGGYIIYQRHPGYRVFIDGRYDMYSVELLKKYLEVARARLGYKDVLDEFKVDWVIIRTGSPISQLLGEDDGWKKVYADGTASIIIRDVPENRAVIDRLSASRPQTGRLPHHNPGRIL